MSFKYFVLSDIHGFAKELKYSLKKAGFDKKNKEHILIICGDIFDRGSEAINVYRFIKSIPKYRRILIRGNHEGLFLELLKKNYPEGHDFHNMTVDTFCQIANQRFKEDNYLMQDYLESYSDNARYAWYTSTEMKEAVTLWTDIVDKVRNSDIYKFLLSKEWRNYYETERFIFVHSFIPTRLKEEYISKYGNEKFVYRFRDVLEYDPNWRDALLWHDATWGCPYELYKQGIFKLEEDKGKTLVCGHCDTNSFFKHLKGTSFHIGEIYYSKGLIGIDGGVIFDYKHQRMIHPQNVLVIDENNVCYDGNGNELKEI